VIQQRTHQADLTGHLLEQGGWTHLCLPAEFERRTVISLPPTDRSIVKQEGDLLWPDREGRAELVAAKHRLGSFGYASQYLQNPIARGGNMFKEEWFGTYREIPKFDALVQSWDCAFKTGQANDYSACVTVGRVDWSEGGSASAPGYYLVHAWRGRVEFAELKRHALALYELSRRNDCLSRRGPARRLGGAFVWGSVGRAAREACHVVFTSSRLTKKSSVSVSSCSVKTAYSDRSTLRVTPTRNSGPIPRIPREEPWPARTR
jgi:hypothetical protein